MVKFFIIALCLIVGSGVYGQEINTSLKSEHQKKKHLISLLFGAMILDGLM